MPKKKKPQRKPVRRSSGRPQSSQPAFVPPDEQLHLGPAKTLLEFPDDPEMQAFMGDWPYAVTAADGADGRMTLAEVAAETNVSLREAAESIVRLEENNFLLWQPKLNEYWMLVPEDTPGVDPGPA